MNFLIFGWVLRWPTCGAQLSVVTEKLNVVTDGGRRKLSVVTDGVLEKGRRYLTFTHTERASVATFDLSDHTNQNTQSICYAYTQRHRHKDTDTKTHTHTHIYIYTRIHTSLTILMTSKNYIKANESIARWLNGLLVSMHNYMLRICQVHTGILKHT